MKTIGLVGGTGWESTAEYYKLINEKMNAQLGGLNFAKCILYSFNYSDIYKLNEAGRIDEFFDPLLNACNTVIEAGSDCIMLCANTLHMFAEKLQPQISVPIIHIAEATGSEINKHGISRVGLLGTKYTMERDFYKDKLVAAGIETLIPTESERKFINDCIFEELLKSIFTGESKKEFLEIINNLKSRGAEGIILGCTEIPLLIKDDDVDMPLFNTTELHARAAVDFAVQKM
jgi:aspartate racemase